MEGKDEELRMGGRGLLNTGEPTNKNDLKLKQS